MRVWVAGTVIVSDLESSVPGGRTPPPARTESGGRRTPGYLIRPACWNTWLAPLAAKAAALAGGVPEISSEIAVSSSCWLWLNAVVGGKALGSASDSAYASACRKLSGTPAKCSDATVLVMARPGKSSALISWVRNGFGSSYSMNFQAAVCWALDTCGLMNMPHGPSGMQGELVGHLSSSKPTLPPASGVPALGVNWLASIEVSPS